MTRRSGVLFAAMCVIWGVPYLLIRVAVRDLAPADVVFARTAIGALLLLPLAVRRRSLPGVRDYWHWLLVYTAIELALPWYLLTAAEEHLDSSLAGLLVAATPLASLVVVRIAGSEEAVTARRLTGLLVGLGGVAALVGLQVGHVDMAAVAEVLVVAVCYATGPVILSRRLAHVPSLGVVTASLAVTAIGYLPAAAVSPPRHVSAESAWSVVGLAVVCTALAFLVFFALIAAIGPSRATVITYVNPAVAIALGVTLLGERLTRGMVVGFPLVLLGSVLATTQRGAGRAAAGDPGQPDATDEEAVVTPG